ncbi:winged helix-turn-helix domain-containing protein [Vibrio paucivorans]|uniref:Transcriptional regulator n=1 Tax=Vibrio paucivorans TaxID=2829489 RepID=A0A9X3CBS8_9VIBR|nr:transcriptional regulator [Vibrio paucivorans]MCW8332675.1 transcriptional regulator [Vibrio paucivorans]
MSNIGTKFILASRFTFDPNSNSLVDQENDSEIVRLGSNESRILLLLSERPNEVVTRNDLHEFVWRDQGFEVDDSSLTQAISTLRKMLKDSTKSPQFVKTVPKRGYELICSVEQSSPLSGGENAPQPVEEPIATTTATVVEEATEAVEAPKVQAPTQAAPVAKAKMSMPTRILLALAVLLPLCVVLFTNPAESKFREVAVYHNVPVMTPTNHPEIKSWLPSIEQCILRYKETHTNELAPVEVIATGGQNNQLILNYIHGIDYSGENVTVRMVAEQEDLGKVCK